MPKNLKKSLSPADALSSIKRGKSSYQIASLNRLAKLGADISRLPYTIRILLENNLRLHIQGRVSSEEVQSLLSWNPKSKFEQEISFMPARVLMQDFTGVPAVVDLAAMRDAMKRMGRDPKKINPLQAAELVIDHSVQVDQFGSSGAFRYNAEKEFERNSERYSFLRWGQKAFSNFYVVPPDTGIVHQVNLEYLARVVMTADGWAFPDTLVGTDSHTTMINGLGVLGWGVGGIEAEAVMLGQPLTMLIPEVVGFRMTGSLREGTTATDLVLTVTEMLRKKGVVGKFVEFFGPGAKSLSLADRATIANMAPEYGATCGFFPVDDETLRYLKLSGRPSSHIAWVSEYLKKQGLFWTNKSPDPVYSDLLELDLHHVETSLAGPSRPQDRVVLSQVKNSFESKKEGLRPKNVGSPLSRAETTTSRDAKIPPLQDGSIVIAAITSCTNTSNPSVMIAAGLLAKKALQKGLKTKPWVKTSLAPGSVVVTDYLKKANLSSSLDKLGFHLVGYGCTTCIGNSGPLPEAISQEIKSSGIIATAILSGNRNFEGRIHADVRANYLASPPLVVAYALAGRINLDLSTEPLGNDLRGHPVYLRDIWPTSKEISVALRKAINSKMFQKRYADVYKGDKRWRSMTIPLGDTYVWHPESTYVRHPPYFENMPMLPPVVQDIRGARVLAVLGDSVTTDHISPAGSIKKASPAGRYLQEHGVSPEDFNSYGARRGNHEVMMRGTFANVRIRNKLVPGVEGGMTRYFSKNKSEGSSNQADQELSIFDAAMAYQKDQTPLVILAGKEYGSGSSRDWAAKGTKLLGVKAVIAESYERIHRSNLVGMGVLPLEFLPGDSAEKLGLTGHEIFEIAGLAEGAKTQWKNQREVRVIATRSTDNARIEFRTRVRIDTPQENEYFCHGGILSYVLRKLMD